MKRLLRRLVPAGVWAWLKRRAAEWQVRAESAADRRRYTRYAALDGTQLQEMTSDQLEAQATKDYHALEKALSLPEPRRPFGEDAAGRLQRALIVARDRDIDAPWVGAAQAAGAAREVWNQGGPIDESVAPLGTALPAGGVAPDFFHSRRSVRNFSREPIPDDLLLAAVDLALTAPSVCNRAPWKVRFFRGPEAISVLSTQNGNRGFTDNIQVVGLVSVELGLFTGVIERYQPWIEGGIFASTFMWALHSLGVQTCMLNLSLRNSAASELRRQAGMPESELPVVMLAIGHAAEGYRVARSRRREISEVWVS